MNGAVLVLNQNYEPLNICNVRRAILLVFDGKAEIIESNGVRLHSATREFPAPSVIRMVYLIRRPHPRVKLTRKEVFIRDGYTCQYCGRQCHDLTIDHVVPRSRGGPHTWENLVSACRSCNHRKAGRTPAEARMDLLAEPRKPAASSYYVFYHYLESQHDWRKFENPEVKAGHAADIEKVLRAWSGSRGGACSLCDTAAPTSATRSAPTIRPPARARPCSGGAAPSDPSSPSRPPRPRASLSRGRRR